MREVIRINQEETTDEPIKFTQKLQTFRGWEETCSKPNNFKQVIYLGNCRIDGDMFCTTSNVGDIEIFKGHLNSGKY